MVSYNGSINKERITKEYINRIRKIWNSQLPDFNKAVPHDAFAVPTLTSTVGILDWACKEIDQIYIKIRKNLAMSGSFHLNGDSDTSYFCRKDGGRGIRALEQLRKKKNNRQSTLTEHQRQK